MSRFVEWAFGPRQLAQGVALVRQAQAGVEFLQEQSAELPHVPPEVEEVRRDLIRLAVQVRDLADAHFWREEGTIAASLVLLLESPSSVSRLTRQLRAKWFALERGLFARLTETTRILIVESGRKRVEVEAEGAAAEDFIESVA